MSGKGSSRRPGEGYATGWDAIFKPKKPCQMCEGHGEMTSDDGKVWLICPQCEGNGKVKED